MIGNERNRFVLQKRDRHLLEEIGVMRVIDREQARRVAPFGSVTRANVRLLALVRVGLLQRFFMGTESGGTKALYMLSPAGARIVGTTSNNVRRKADQVVVADLFVTHQSHINEMYCECKYGPAAPDGTRFTCWRSFSENLGPVPLIPDGYLECDGSSTLSAFVEIDLAHERLSVWQGKVRNYLRYASSGRFKEQFGKSRFLVLAICNSQGRTQSLRAATAALTDKIFRFATFASISEAGLWASIWFLASGDQPQKLLETI